MCCSSGLTLGNIWGGYLPFWDVFELRVIQLSIAWSIFKGHFKHIPKAVTMIIMQRPYHLRDRHPISQLIGLRLRATSHTTPSESPWPLHFKHSHWWKRRSWSKFTLHYAWGTNGVCECKMDVKSTWIPTWHQMDHVSWSLGLFSKTTSWR